MEIEVALIGNPNVGKSLIFNNLTGGRAHVGNWPGKTVERKEGIRYHKGVKMHIVDLPGIYSLTARSVDELIARTYIVEEKPDVVIDIVDASNLERNLYLTLQLLELEANLVIALNKIDLAEEVGYEIDIKALSEILGVPVVPTIATKNIGMTELLDAVVKAAREGGRRAKMSYEKEIDELISMLEGIISKDRELVEKYPARWLAIKLLERDEDVLKKVMRSPCWSEVKEVIE